MIKKPLSFKQRLALLVHSATTLETGVSFPYGFERYAKVVAAKRGNKYV